ncbi:df878db1-43fb-43c0-9089-fd467e82150e [Thermothielavioides terrestris]|uniref:Large ribosomal subunit protein mL50 n=1 Tax=Thermothielavioides terrestris TaxID=2587410 RepID=A0A3S4BAZ5_9PEZI|nr:df878db1-43fb-43c0-9089-fd467e82150e [Thermothielavioides terrestris]
MRRIPRLRNPAPAGFVPSQIPTGALRTPAAASMPVSSTLCCSTTTRHTSTGYNAPGRPQQQRYISTTTIRRSQAQPEAGTPSAAPAEEHDELADLSADDFYPPSAAEIPTQLVYPREVTTAPPASAVADPSYKPADTAEGLEEVGGLADWWDDPAHWGGEDGVGGFVRSTVARFGPAERVSDPAVLEVLARRAIVEALVVARFAGPRKRHAVDRLFSHAHALHGLGRIINAEIVAGEDGAATLKSEKDWQRVWDLLKAAVKKARQQQPQQQPQQEPEGEGELSKAEEKKAEADATEAEVAEEAEEAVDAEAHAPAPQLTPKRAQKFIRSWTREWRKAELRDPVVKFFAAKRIQQLTGHRIPDGKLVAIRTIDSLLKQLVEPPKPKKLAELVEATGAFKGLPNVRVFPRRVTPIDKEKMVGRWKIIVKELEKRNLPVVGTGDYGKAVEKKWIEGKV